MLSAKPPPGRIPKGTLGLWSPPSPHATRARRPGSLKITSSCASTGCGAVTLTASRRPRRHCGCPPCGSHRASLQASFPPAVRAAVGEIWRGKTPARQKEAGGRIIEPPDAQEARRRVASPRPPSIHLPGEAGRATRQPHAKPARIRVQQDGVARMRDTQESDQSQQEAGFKNRRFSAQQIATPEVRNRA